MKHHCKHCDIHAKIMKTQNIGGTLVLMKLECGHDSMIKREIWEEKERKAHTLLARFKDWAGFSEEEE